MNPSLKSEIAGRVGAATTGAGYGLSHLVELDPMFKTAATVITCLVGIATLAYYTLAVIEKWRNLRK